MHNQSLRYRNVNREITSFYEVILNIISVSLDLQQNGMFFLTK